MAQRLPEIVGLIGFILWAVVERGFSLLNQQQSGGEQRDRWSYILISLCWYGAVFFSLLDAWSQGWTLMDSSLRALQWAGCGLTLAGIVIRFVARRELGRQYSVQVETSQAHRLVTSGIYRTLRHPAYLGLVCLLVGIPLCEGSLGGLLIALLGGIPAVMRRIQVEERALTAWFGRLYEEYRQTTKRLIPYVW